MTLEIIQNVIEGQNRRREWIGVRALRALNVCDSLITFLPVFATQSWVHVDDLSRSAASGLRFFFKALHK